ncbi:hypothetical protein FHP29_10800 [Nocardioides albidus]|uniref:Pyrrolo-quinoline quinone repeat domain-containing protein n=1 Tax=Nocardioides albidus TaxID=1517589 RepID=A0A5C4VX70_9ACTN|nr:hypothetical protein [Nocardioides albidus]TNM40524.1 hypothetical protein FHP29_10800 [Nocardioides albidus]
MSPASPTGRLAAALLVAGLGLVACDGGRPDPDRPGGSDPSTGGSGSAAAVLHEPASTWELRADTVVPGGKFVPLAPAGDDEVPQPGGVVVGEVLVAAITDQAQDDADPGARPVTPLLVGVSAEGKVLWKQEGYGGCWTPDHAALYCTRGDALVRVDAATGGSGAGADVRVAPGSTPILDDGVLYLVVTPEGTDESAYPPPFAVAALDATSLKDVWTGPGGLAELRGYGAGSPALDLSGDDVSVAAWKDTPSGQADATQFELDRASGKVLGSAHLGKSSFFERPWTVHRGFGDDKLEVLLGDEVLLKLSGQAWDTQDSRLTTTEGRLGVGSTLYDVTTGKAVWERPDLGDELSGWRWTSDRTQVAVTGFDAKKGTMVTTYLDAETGKTLWSGPGTEIAPSETPDAFLQVATDYAKSWVVQALDRTSGEVAWSHDVSALGKEGYDDGISPGGPYVSDEAVWVVGAGTLAGFTGFPG